MVRTDRSIGSRFKTRTASPMSTMSTVSPGCRQDWSRSDISAGIGKRTGAEGKKEPEEPRRRGRSDAKRQEARGKRQKAKRVNLQLKGGIHYAGPVVMMAPSPTKGPKTPEQTNYLRHPSSSGSTISVA